MTGDLFRLLERSSVAAGVAVLVVFAIRLPLRKIFGCEAAYAVWLLVPLLVVAALIPAPQADLLHVAGVLTVFASGEAIRSPASPSSGSREQLLLWLWLGGCIVAAAWQIRQQRIFVRGLGVVSRVGDVAYSESSLVGPVLIGVLKPLIVLPPDFDRCYSQAERELIIAHERAHARRGDPAANLLCALARCIWWFDPLVHVAARLVRSDQELACDAAVMRAHPRTRRAYANALLKTSRCSDRPPIACPWRSTHPLKERLMNLTRTTSQAASRIGSAVVAVALLGASCAAWAAGGAAIERRGTIEAGDAPDGMPTLAEVRGWIAGAGPVRPGHSHGFVVNEKHEVIAHASIVSSGRLTNDLRQMFPTWPAEDMAMAGNACFKPTADAPAMPCVIWAVVHR